MFSLEGEEWWYAQPDLIRDESRYGEAYKCGEFIADVGSWYVTYWSVDGDILSKYHFSDVSILCPDSNHYTHHIWWGLYIPECEPECYLRGGEPRCDDKVLKRWAVGIERALEELDNQEQ